MDANVNVLTEEQKHRETVKKVNRLYILTLVFCGAAVLGALVWAVLDSVFMGLVLGICSIIVYMALTANILYRYLGISYKSETGRLTVTQLYGRGREAVRIPGRIIMLDVTEIGDRAFAHRSSAAMKTLYLPATLEVIGKDIFEGCESLTRIYFEGSREAFEGISCATDLSSYEIICAGEDEPDAEQITVDEEQIADTNTPKTAEGEDRE